MSERGVFAVDRGVFEHDCFADEPFTEREAWIWLVGEASWKPRARRIGRINVQMKRGQIAASLRFLGERWGWDKARVERFLVRLKNRDMIATANETGITVITICNYDAYQKVSLPIETVNETQNETATRQQRDKRESNKNIEEDSEAIASDAAAPPVYTDSKHELFGEGVAILVALGVPKPRPIIGRWLRDAKDDAQLVLGAIQRARDNRVMDPVPWITRAISTKGPANAAPQVRPQQPWQQRRDDWFSALDELNETVAAADAGDEGGSTALRLVVPSGRG